MKNCKTREEIIEKVLLGGSHLEASKRFLELGFIDEAIKFYLLSQQEIFLEGFNQQMAVMEEIVNKNNTAGCSMIEASQNNQSAAQMMIQAAEENKGAAMQMCNAAGEIQQASRKMHQY